uniref:Uncharacterized protein n=1 Tax=Trypanosoma congolense (strain IL3000) TaxID=1068625 RepID=G0UV91_TRYCI|nr:conserved hypothetical protein [Trypanosoma congolense IL3000]
MHPEIEELKRRNRAPGKRLPPLPPESQRGPQRPSTYYSKTHSDTSAKRRLVRSESQSSKHLEDKRRTSDNPPTHSSSKTTSLFNNTSSGKRGVESERTDVTASPSSNPTPHKIPTKPHTREPGRTRNSIDVRNGNSNNRIDPATCVATVGSVTNTPKRSTGSPPSAPNAASSDGLSSTSNQPAESVARCGYSQGGEEPVANDSNTTPLDHYLSKRKYNKSIPDDVLRVLEGNSLEEPFTTDLWARSYGVEEQRTTGQYACVRCGMPLVVPRYQLRYSVRGIAAFERMHWDGVAVRIGGLSSAPGSGRCGRGELELQVRCRCCDGFIGIIVPDLEGESRNIFVVNSCCLRYDRVEDTQCKLDNPCGANCGGDILEGKVENTQGDRLLLVEEGEIDFDDPDIFEVD